MALPRSSSMAGCAAPCATGCVPRPISPARWPASASSAVDRAILRACAMASMPVPRSRRAWRPSPACRRCSLRWAARSARPAAGLAGALRDALDDALPLARRDGGFVRPGFDADLDETRALRDESRRVIAALQARYAQDSGVRQLKIKHNNVLGYFVEVPQQAGEDFLKPPLRETFMHRQTMAGAMRFSTVELSGIEARIASAADRALALELAIFDRLAAQALADADAIRAATDAIARLDVVAGLAELAALEDWTRPEVDGSLAFAIEGGRHPVVEAALKADGKPFIANDCDLSGEDAGRIWLLTGPNMAGKSTFLRQNALIAVLAQMGAFVPARRARIGIVDCLFSRVGAADDLARGRSTFMVEMVETAAILNQAGPRALVILDEIGRGTATFDGLSIAWAAIENLHEANRCRALFATHYHELTQLSKALPRLANATMRVTEWKGDVVFLHEVAPVPPTDPTASRSPSSPACPARVVERAKTILASLEASDRQAPKARLLDDLPLFAAAPRAIAAAPSPRRTPSPLALDGLDPDEMTPAPGTRRAVCLESRARRVQKALMLDKPARDYNLIIDRMALEAEIDALAIEHEGDGPALRTAVVLLLKASLAGRARAHPRPGSRPTVSGPSAPSACPSSRTS